MNRIYFVDLTDEERERLVSLTRSGKPSARRVIRAHILLMADGHEHTDQQIAKALSSSTSTVFRTRRRFVEGGLDHALAEKASDGRDRLLTNRQESTLVALACSTPPKGRSRWTLRLLAKHLILVCDDLEAVSHETVRKRLREKQIKPWLHKMWCLRKIDAAFIAQMEDILDLYTEAADPRFPVICFDEGLKQLVAEVKKPRLTRPGSPAQFDYHYRRNGTAKLLVFLDAHRPWREVLVTERRTRLDFAEAMKKLVDEYYSDAERVRVVLDNLNTHNAASLYEAFPAPEARRIMRRLEFHYTPTHASWLNMVEIEIGAITTQCLNRRIGDIEFLRDEMAACVASRNEDETQVKWLFDVQTARQKMERHYPKHSSNYSKAA